MSQWNYDNARSSSHGEMKCCVCQGTILEGQYRYRKKSRKGDWYYQSQHRTCSETDTMWAEIDASRMMALNDAKELSRACREFQRKWLITDLSDYIRDDDMQEKQA